MADLTGVLAAPTWIGVIGLALVGALYLVKLGLDFFKSTVLPRAYERRLKQRSILLPFAQKVLDSSWGTSAYFRDGDPKLIDYREGCIFPRPELANARALLQKGRFLHVQGPPSSGKTVIALHLAYEWSKVKRTTLYFSRPALLTDTFFEFLATSAAARLLDQRGAALVVDDVHLDPARCSRLFSFVYTNYSKLSLLFVSRPLRGDPPEVDGTTHYDFARYMPSIEVRAETILQPLADFFSQKRFGHPIPPPVLKAFTEECGNDLLLLGRYLREWTGSPSVHLPDLRRKVFHTVRTDLEQLRALSPDAITALFVVSVFYRFEVPVERRFLEGHLGLHLMSLLKSGDVTEQNGFVLLHHSSMAKLYTNVCRSLRMPEYAALEIKYSPMPGALFSAYTRSEPRNLCELIVDLRRTRDVLPSILTDRELHRSLRSGLERERSLNLLGWAMLVIYVAGRRHGWHILKDVDLSGVAREVVPGASPEEMSLFIFNLSRVSRTKSEEWVTLIPPTTMAQAIQSMSLLHAGATLARIRQCSSGYFESLAEALDPTSVCQMVLHEDNIDDLKVGVAKLGQLLGHRVCIKAYASEDAFGEWMTRLSFFFDTARVIRFLRGRRLGIPFASSASCQEAHLRRLLGTLRPGCAMRIDEGAALALSRRKSLFPVGVSAVEGEFSRGDVVGIVDLDGRPVGAGVSNFASSELQRIIGMRSDDIREKTGMAPNRVMDNDLIVVGARFARLQPPNESLQRTASSPKA